MQLSEEDKRWVAKWLRKAEGDLRVAERLAESPEFYEQAAFHCQQAAEKYAKGYLRAFNQDAPKTHDIERLLDLLQNQAVFFSDDERELASLLTPFATLSRYPLDTDIEPPMADLLAAARHFRDRLCPAIEAALR